MKFGNAVGCLPSSFVPILVHSLWAIASSRIGAEPRICPLPLPRILLSSVEKQSRLLGISFFGQPVLSR